MYDPFVTTCLKLFGETSTPTGRSPLLTDCCTFCLFSYSINLLTILLLFYSGIPPLAPYEPLPHSSPKSVPMVPAVESTTTVNSTWYLLVLYRNVRHCVSSLRPPSTSTPLEPSLSSNHTSFLSLFRSQ